MEREEREKERERKHRWELERERGEEKEKNERKRENSVFPPLLFLNFSLLSSLPLVYVHVYHTWLLHEFVCIFRTICVWRVLEER